MYSFCLIFHISVSPCLFSSVLRASKRVLPTQSSPWICATSSMSPRRARKRDMSYASRCLEVKLWSSLFRAKSRPRGGSRYLLFTLLRVAGERCDGVRKWRFSFSVSRWCKMLAASVAKPKDQMDPLLPLYRGSWSSTRFVFMHLSSSHRICPQSRPKLVTSQIRFFCLNQASLCQWNTFPSLLCVMSASSCTEL